MDRPNSEISKLKLNKIRLLGLLYIEGVIIKPINLKGLAQAKIIKKSLILFWLLNMTI